jgi:4a-hydroxytetrahydrobiopterin dehydratase
MPDPSEILSPDAVAQELEGSAWRVEDGMLVRDTEHKGFRAAVAFVNQVAEVADRLNHHPDIFLHDYKVVTLRTVSHDVGGLTERDLRLAREVDAVAPA